MRNFILVLIFITVYIFGVQAQSQKEIKAVAQALKSMIKIPQEKDPDVNTIWDGTDLKIIPTVADSNFIIPVNAYGYMKQYSFYLSDHEVTNTEYKKFIIWVRDSLMKVAVMPMNPLVYRYTDYDGNIQNVNVLPDSLQWTKSGDHDGDLLSDSYHNNIEFDSYPVVNVSWEQAQAYIHWLNDRFKELLLNNNLYKSDWGKYRLPEADEWEFAVFSGRGWLDENQTAKRLYAWDGWQVMYGNKYQANFGNIIDQNGVTIKNPYDDGYSYTSPVKKFPQGILGLYDMSGNVSEWTNTSFTLDSLKEFYRNFYRKTLGGKNSDYAFLFDELYKENPDWSLFEKEVNKALGPDTIGVERYRPHMRDILIYLKECKKDELHNANVLKRIQNAIIVKGGSWNDAPCYLMNSSRQVFSKTTANPEIGFRVALTLSPELQKLLGKYMLKK